MADYVSNGESPDFLLAVKGAGAAARLMNPRDIPLAPCFTETNLATWWLLIMQLEVMKHLPE